MSLVYLSLGSNIEDRVGFVQQATSLLSGEQEIKIVSTSSFYETEPCGFETENWFVNAVLAISTTLSPEELFAVCQRIEKQLGRVRTKENEYEDRTIDIDILFYDNRIIDEDIDGQKLLIPHISVQDRAFVLVPFLEVAPDFVHPVYKKTISQLYDEIDDPEMVYLYGTRFM